MTKTKKKMKSVLLPTENKTAKGRLEELLDFDFRNSHNIHLESVNCYPFGTPFQFHPYKGGLIVDSVRKYPDGLEVMEEYAKENGFKKVSFASLEPCLDPSFLKGTLVYHNFKCNYVVQFKITNPLNEEN